MPDDPLHLLVPFALVPAADAQIALSRLDYPALGALLARATETERATGEDFQRTLPHERWLAAHYGLLAARAATDDAPLAPYMLLADGGAPGDARWACVEPAHVQIARDHLVLIDPDTLGLADHEAATLLDAARPAFDALGIRVEAPTPRRWYVSGAALGELVAAPPLRAAGRSIEIWLPHDAGTGERSRAWMKLQNEVQMSWFEHPLNAARESQGLPAVNGLWLYSQGTRAAHLNRPFAKVLSRSAATRGLGLAQAPRSARRPKPSRRFSPRLRSRPRSCPRVPPLGRVLHNQRPAMAHPLPTRMRLRTRTLT
ncbi:MAG: regulator [Pararobbsia sp.]